MSDIYKRASKIGLRFQTAQGLLAVEDLWNIPLQSTRGTSLDAISKIVHKELKNDDDFSLIDKEKKSDEVAQLRFDIIKDVIETRIAERDAKSREKAEADRRQRILGIIEEKKEQKLSDMPIEELEKLLEKDATNA